jgi:serine/threonine-protein kinase
VATSAPGCPPAERWQQHLAGSLPDAEQAVLVAHLGDCPTCQQTLQTLAGGDSLLGVAREVGQDAAAAEPVPQRVIEGLRGQVPGGETQPEAAADDDLPLDFLKPTERPGSLGRLGHHEILAVVGRGGMGVVFRALDTRLQRVVAVKVLAPQLAASGPARQRFLREARAAAAVSHDHVVAIHAVEEADGFPYIVMQYVAGTPLEKRLARDGALPVREVLRIGLQMAQGLAAAHAQGLVHRDVKPANVLLENGIERVKLADFGLARAAEDARLTQTGCLAGTPLYMSPEQADGGSVDARSDLFSLGSVLYEMCAGYPPFRGPTRTAVLRAVSEARPRPVREANPEVPDRLAAVIAKLLTRDPAERYQTADEVARVLGQMLAGVQQPGPAPRRRRPIPRRILVMAGGVAATLAAVLLAVLLLLRWPGHTGGTATEPSVELNLPADLARLKPLIDENWRGLEPNQNALRGVDADFDHEWYASQGAHVIEFHKTTKHDYRFGRFVADIWARHYACRLVGRLRPEERTALVIFLRDKSDNYVVFVRLASNGKLDVRKAPNTPPFRFPRQESADTAIMRPDKDGNKLLVIVQDRRVQILVNGRNLFGRALELPEEMITSDPARGAWCEGREGGRVEHVRWTVWDLDHPRMDGEKPCISEKAGRLRGLSRKRE